MRTILSTALIAIAMASGCNRQDTDCLSRIGHKVSAHAKNNTGDIGSKVDLHWPTKKEPTLKEKIQDRLRYENTLTELTLEVHVKDKEVELKGNVKTAIQRQRAIELAETLAGVEKVTDAIVVKDAEEAAK